MPFLPCFLPPIGFLPRPDGTPPRPSIHAGVAAMLMSAIAALLVFTPVGWSRPQPTVELHMGVSAVLPLRTEEQSLAAQMSCAPRRNPQPCKFMISPSSYGSVPPGLALDRNTGVLAGLPTLPGTYTLAIDIDDGRAHVLTGPAFKIRVVAPETADPSSVGRL